MGYLFKGVCYADLSQAKAADCSQSATSWGAGGVLYTSQCTSTDFTATTKTLCVQADGAACVNQQITYPTYPPCDYDGTTNVSSEWFIALLGFLAVIYVSKRLKDIFWGRHESI